MEFNLSNIELSKNDLKRNIKLPNQLTKELAELIGIIIGDGHISINHGFLSNGDGYVRYNINIAGNSDEEQYLKYVMNLFNSLFNLKLVYKKVPDSKSAILRIHSKGLVQFLNEICEIPLGRKTDIVFIPEIVKNSNEDIKYAFLRGLADTDFSVCFKNRTGKGHNYPVIKGSFKSRILIQNLENLFKELDFKYCVCYDQERPDKRFSTTTIHSIYLNGTNNSEKWMDKIGFSNSKFQRKVEKWQKDGVCPPGY